MHRSSAQSFRGGEPKPENEVRWGRMTVAAPQTVISLAGLTFPLVGAQADRDGVMYRVWAPDHQNVRVVTGPAGGGSRYVQLQRDAAGFFAGHDARGKPGDLYWLQIPIRGVRPSQRLLPDPASRFQPEGVEGPSQVIDPGAFEWAATEWHRPPLRGRVIYELHVGTFTTEGTFRAAISRLDALVDLGVNTLELMPVGDFAGRRNWGYDGVMIFAPAHGYGAPDDLRALVDAAHARGLAMILDVVYNHLGPVGNVLPALSSHYFHERKESGWGAALNFDGGESAPVRQFFLQNAAMWLDEFRFDGLRLDAVHAIHDSSESHLVAQIAAAARERGAFVIAEDDRNEAKIVTPVDRDGWGLDGMWSDDFHHTMRVGLTGQCEAHFANYSGAVDEWVETLRAGWFYGGQYFKSWQRTRGTPGDALAPEQFIFCISNHDQVGNRPLGDRLHEVISPETYRAVSMLLCLTPFTPLLFMGQEWAASARFPFFTDHPGEIGANMRGNRLKEFERYNATHDASTLARMPDPQAEETFRAAKLDWSERERPVYAATLALYRDCLRVRAQHSIFQSPPRTAWRVQRVGEGSLGLRWSQPERDWLLVTAMAAGEPSITDEPFVRPRAGRQWQVVLDSEDERFGGRGVARMIAGEGIPLRGPGTLLLREF